MAMTAMVSASPETRSYEECTGRIEQDPAAGLDYAEAWRVEGGGDPALHCQAIAMLASGQGTRAGQILTGLADRQIADAGVAAKLYIQAAEAFMAVGQKDEAYAALKSAYAHAADTPEVHMSAAAIYATGEEWDGVILTIKALERFVPLSADAYILRGRAYFSKGELEKAASETSAALKIDPYLVDAIVLRGDLIGAGVSIPDDPFAAR